MTPQEEALVEAACTAWRSREVGGTIAFHPAWHDLDAPGRREVFYRTLVSRVLEQAVDSQGLSSTARAVMARIRRG